MKQEILPYFESFAKTLNGKILLAVSGGMDSMCLWYLVRKFNIPHAVAHVNYGLRGKDSKLDQQLVEKVAEKHAIQCFVKHIHKQDFKSLRKMGIQEAARKFRYDWFEELKQEHLFSHICTAHHLDDSVETFFINLSRGAGLKGLGGIRTSDERVRPLLHFSREEIEQLVAKKKIKYREDGSNVKEVYLRNWVRHSILKKWKKKDDAFLRNAGKSIDLLQESQVLLDFFLQREIENLKFSLDQLPLKIPVKKLGEERLGKELLFQMVANFGFNRDQIHDLFQAILSKRTGAMVFSPSHRLMVDRENLILDELDQDLSFTSLHIPEEGIEVEDPMGLSIDCIDSSQVIMGQKNTEYLDASLLNFPLELRRWKEGDKMIPLGMKGSKKISDILIDAKISRHEKEQTYVLISKEEVVALVKHKISENYKLNEKTSQVLRIQWKS